MKDKDREQEKAVKKEITKNLIINFNIINEDFMGYNLTKNEYSYHHILKRCDGGLITYSNGAILNKNTSHNYLHLIENKELDMYKFINIILKDVNTQGYLPTDEQLLKIYDCLESFERTYCSTLNSKNKPLIKERYIINRKNLKKFI